VETVREFGMHFQVVCGPWSSSKWKYQGEEKCTDT